MRLAEPGSTPSRSRPGPSRGPPVGQADRWSVDRRDLVEGGIAAQAAGRGYVAVGGRLLRGGAFALAGQAGFGISYAATTFALCNNNPSY